MRVALVTSNYPPEFVGGTERVVCALARALRDAGDDVLVVTGSDVPHAGSDVVSATHEGIPVLRLPRRADEPYGMDVSRPRVRALLVAELRRTRRACVHVHHWATLSSGTLRAAREAGIPGIATLHDLWTTCPRFFRRPPAGITCPTGAARDACADCIRRDLPGLDDAAARASLAARDADLRAELDAAHAVTVPSETSRARIAAQLPFERPLEVVPHGLLEPVTDRASPARGGRLRVGTFGNLVEEKGVLLLVEACAGLPGIELRLAGRFLDPAFEARVRARAQALGVPLVTTGAYGAAGVHPACDLDLAVFPSLCEETYGLVVEEALARGVPVLVSDRGALRERIGEAGLVVAVDDPAPLAALLRGFAAEPSRLTDLRAKLPRHFATMSTAADRYRALYARACREGAS